jgi:hypothetical protein
MIDDTWRRKACWLLFMAGLFQVAGCGGAPTGANAPDYSSIRAMTGFYEWYLGENKHQPPKDEQQFRAYLQGKQDSLDEFGLTVDEMFASPRGEKLQWVYGKKPPSGPAGMMYIAYESRPVDGKRLVLSTRGMHEEMDETRFQAVFRNTQ